MLRRNAYRRYLDYLQRLGPADEMTKAALEEYTCRQDNLAYLQRKAMQGL